MSKSAVVFESFDDRQLSSSSSNNSFERSPHDSAISMSDSYGEPQLTKRASAAIGGRSDDRIRVDRDDDDDSDVDLLPTTKPFISSFDRFSSGRDKIDVEIGRELNDEFASDGGDRRRSSVDGLENGPLETHPFCPSVRRAPTSPASRLLSESPSPSFRSVESIKSGILKT